MFLLITGVLFTLFAPSHQTKFLACEPYAVGIASTLKDESGAVYATLQDFQCAMARDSVCTEEVFFVNYFEIWYCGSNSIATQALFFIATVVIIIALFYLMSSTAEDHFSVALQTISDILRLSKDLAGLTFLALGNGATDFFTALAGADKKPGLILSSSASSGLFLTTFLLGLTLHYGNPGETLLAVPKASFLRSGLMYSCCFVVLLIIYLRQKIEALFAAVMVVCFFAYIATAVSVHVFKQRKDKQKRKKSFIDVSLDDVEKQTLKTFPTWTDFIAHSLGLSEMSCFGKIRLALAVPFDFLTAMTILPTKPALFDACLPIQFRKFQRFRIVANPFFSLALLCLVFKEFFLSIFQDNFVHLLIAYIVASVALSLGLWASTSLEKKPAFFALHLAIAFAFCIIWIYVASSELVSALSALGPIIHVDQNVMGIVLAWGNSFGDVMADLAIAKAGGFETAVTAIFAGPIQNILLTIGVVFFFKACKEVDKIASITELKKSLGVTFGILGFSTILTIGLVVFYFDYKIPRKYGYFLIALYLISLPTTIIAAEHLNT